MSDSRIDSCIATRHENDTTVVKTSIVVVVVVVVVVFVYFTVSVHRYLSILGTLPAVAVVWNPASRSTAVLLRRHPASYSSTRSRRHLHRQPTQTPN